MSATSVVGEIHVDIQVGYGGLDLVFSIFHDYRVAQRLCPPFRCLHVCHRVEIGYRVWS
jgi:hypothetical protein